MTLKSRLRAVAESYRQAVMQAYIKEQLSAAADAELLGLVLDTFFAFMPYGRMANRLVEAMAGLDIQSTSGLRAVAAIVNNDSLVETLVKQAGRTVQGRAKKSIPRVMAGPSRRDEITNYISGLADRATIWAGWIGNIAEARLDDSELVALTMYYDNMVHTAARYETEIAALLKRFKADVASTANNSVMGQVAVRIVGPYGAALQSRVALCHRYEPRPHRPRYQFLRWASDDMAPLAERKQSAKTAPLTLSYDDQKFNIPFVNEPNPLGKIPEVQRWLRQSTPEFTRPEIAVAP